MLKRIVIYIVLLAFIVAVAWLLSLLINREMQKRQKAQEERIKRLAATEEGKRILAEESTFSKKCEPILNILWCLASLMMLALGLFGIYDFVTEISAGKKISEIIFSDRGFYLISPIIIVYSISQLINIVKAWVSSNQNSQDSATEADK